MKTRASALTVPGRWREMLFLGSVAMALAAFGILAALHIRGLTQTASAHYGVESGADGLPDVMGNRCLN